MKCKNCEKFKKREKRVAITLYIAFIFLFIFILLILFNPIINDYVETIATSLTDKTLLFSFSKVSDRWQSNEYVNSVYTLCNLKKDNYEKVLCVYEVLNNFYEFNDSMPLNILKQPKELLESGGVCRDYATFIDSVLKKMGFESEIVIAPSHAYNYAKINNKDCYMDLIKDEVYCNE